MIQFGGLILVLLVSFTISLPTCNLSFWVNLNGTTCTASPNGSYSALAYNGNCTLSPSNPRQDSYKLLIDVDTKTVQNFTVYDGKTCAKGYEMLVAKTPLSLNSCGLLYYKTSSTTSVEIGTFIFNCQE